MRSALRDGGAALHTALVGSPGAREVEPRGPPCASRLRRFPFTACEVFCCEVEAVFNTLLEDAELMQLLFSLLDAPAPLASKTAGYFGRVVGHLLLRKTNEVVQYLQENPQLLERLVQHVDTTSIAEILKRLVGADEQSSVLFLAQYAPWLAETPLVDLLLGKLAHGSSPDAQANAADILCAIAHTQPSPLATTLTRPESVAALFTHGMAPGQQVLVPALDVCIALIEPRRSAQALEDAPMQDAAYKAKVAAVDAIVQYVPALVDLLRIGSGAGATTSAGGGADPAGADPSAAAAPGAIPPSPSSLLPPALETPYGMLTPPLGRARLKAVELLAVLLRSGSPAVEAGVMQTGAVSACLQLFAAYPFNNLLHHCVVAMLVAILTKSSGAMLQHIFEHCRLIEWLVNLPTDIRPAPIPGQEELAASKPLVRAGYMGHITQIASTLESFTSQGSEAEEQPGRATANGVAAAAAAEAATASSGAAAAAEGADAAVAAAAGAGEPPEAAASGSAAAAGGPQDGAAAGSDGAGGEALPAGAGGGGGGAPAASVNSYLKSSPAWSAYLHEVLQPRQELENTSRWVCGRPTATELAGLDSDGDEFQVRGLSRLVCPGGSVRRRAARRGCLRGGMWAPDGVSVGCVRARARVRRRRWSWSTWWACSRCCTTATTLTRTRATTTMRATTTRTTARTRSCSRRAVTTRTTTWAGWAAGRAAAAWAARRSTTSQ